MNLEQQVTSLEPSKRLSELGVKQDSLFYWILLLDDTQEEVWKVISKEEWRIAHSGSFVLSAFTVAELGSMLPEAYSSSKGADNKWMCVNEMKSRSHGGSIMFADTECDARAKMLVYLLENKLIQLLK